MSFAAHQRGCLTQRLNCSLPCDERGLGSVSKKDGNKHHKTWSLRVFWN